MRQYRYDTVLKKVADIKPKIHTGWSTPNLDQYVESYQMRNTECETVPSVFPLNSPSNFYRTERLQLVRSIKLQVHRIASRE